MNSRQTASISKYINANCLYCLLLLITTPAVIIASPSVSTAQINNTAKINRPTLTIGTQGERVSELQAALKLLGFYTGAVDGIYQEGTASAVSRFQVAAGLNPIGIVDNNTWQKLFPSVSTQATTVNTSSPATNNNRVNSVPEPKPATPKRPNRQTQTSSGLQPTPANQRFPNIQYTAEGWPILRLGNRGPEVIKLQQQLKKLGFFKGAVNGVFGTATEAAVKAAQTSYKLAADGVAGGATWNAMVQQSSR
jgi:peptidoglycan hydrolase-like protein with peptidoglycan-binding domain